MHDRACAPHHMPQYAHECFMQGGSVSLTQGAPQCVHYYSSLIFVSF